MAENDKEDKFTRLDGTIIQRSDIVAQSIQYYNELYDKNLSDVCDFSEGSEIRTLHESFAVELYHLYLDSYNLSLQKFVQEASGAYLDMLACEFGISRKGSEVATGSVTFTVNDPLSAVISIPRGTIIVARTTGFEYVLAEDVYISAGTTSSNGRVYSRITGAKYNCLTDTLTAFKDTNSVYRTVKVTNNDEITGGVDAETDEELRTRILNVKKERAFGTITSYTNMLLENVDGLHDVQFVSPTLSNLPRIHYNPKTGEVCTSCSKIVYVNATSKPCPDSVLEDVEYYLTQQNNLVVGHEFHIEKAEPIPIYFRIRVYVNSIIEEDVFKENIEAFFNGDEYPTSEGVFNYQGINIRGTLYKSRMIDCIERIAGVVQVESIHRIKYLENLPDIDSGKWQTNTSGSTTYNYTVNNYTYTYDTKTKTYNHWGATNFDQIQFSSGKVIQLGQLKDVDSSTENIFDLEQIIQE